MVFQTLNRCRRSQRGREASRALLFLPAWPPARLPFFLARRAVGGAGCFYSALSSLWIKLLGNSTWGKTLGVTSGCLVHSALAHMCGSKSTPCTADIFMGPRWAQRKHGALTWNHAVILCWNPVDSGVRGGTLSYSLSLCSRALGRTLG